MHAFVLLFRKVYSIRSDRIAEALVKRQDVSDVTVFVTGKELDEMVTKEKNVAALTPGPESSST